MKNTINLDEKVSVFGNKLVIYLNEYIFDKDTVVNYSINGFVFVKDRSSNLCSELNNGATLTKGSYDFYLINRSPFKILSYTSVLNKDMSNNCEYEIKAPYDIKLQINPNMLKEFLDYSLTIRDSKQAMSLSALKEDLISNINKFINHVISSEVIEETVNLSLHVLDVCEKSVNLINSKSELSQNGIVVLSANIELHPETEYIEKKKEILFLRSI